MEKISLRVPAKINLYLKVLRKRSDGYHDIDSLMQAVSLYDELTLEKANDIILDCDGLAGLIPEDNLAYKSARLVAEMAEYPGVKITLKKNIPQGAGLGGGSADAAFVIRGLINLYGLTLSKNELINKGSRLGADIPFFLSCGQARVTGLGDLINECELPADYEILIIKPDFSISTSWAYDELDNSLPGNHNSMTFERGISLSDFFDSLNQTTNDFEKVVFSRYPELAAIKQRLRLEGALYEGMSGSGSAIFGLFESGRALDNIAGKFKTDVIRTYICRPILLESLG